MTLSKLVPVRDRNLEDLFGRGTFWPNVDWSKTRAYALALGQVYVNLQGRERLGVVPTGRAYNELREGLVKKFGALRDPDTGEGVVRKVYTREELYRGPYFDEAPDLVVGFERGYRVSWQTSLGGIPPQVIEWNERRWSADHCSVDPGLVPGVLSSSRPLDAASNVLNQVTDLEADAINKPARPLPSGRVSATEAVQLSGWLYIVAFLLAVPVGPQCTLLAGTAATLTVAYSAPPLRWKSVPYLANLVIAIPRGLLLKVAGWSCVRDFGRLEPWYIGAIFGLFLLG